MNESDRIILARGLEKTTPDKLRWQLSQSGFIITFYISCGYNKKVIFKRVQEMMNTLSSFLQNK